MRVVIVSQYFWPESFIINQVAEELARQGHQLTVLTGKPNYPDGEIYQGYQQRGTVHEKVGEIEVIRVPLRPRSSADAKALLLNYLSFIWSGLTRFPSLLKGREYDAVLVFAPSPITSAIPAIPIKYLKHAHLAVWVQDLWPESLSATGFIKNKSVLKLVRYLVKGIYAASDTLLVQSQAFANPIAELTKQEKIHYFPNVINDMLEKKSEIDIDKIPKELIEYLERYFCLVFAGNIGKAQSIKTLIDTAEKLVILSDVRIVMVGAGSELAWAKSEVKKRALQNILFTGSFSIEAMPTIFRRAEALLVSLNAQPIFSYTIPSKVQAYMSAGRPIMASINGEAARVIREAKAGLTSPAEDAEGLAGQITRLFEMPEQDRDIMATNSRQYFLENFEMSQQCENLIRLLEQRIDQKSVLSK